MKNFFASMIVALALSGICCAETIYTPDQPEHVVSFVTNASNVGVLSFTNEIAYPWRLGRLWLQCPALQTNTMTVTYVSTFDESPEYKGWTVETNGFSQVVTNWYPTITNFVSKTITNNLIALGATNLLVGVVDTAGTTPRIPENTYILPNSVLRFSFSYTNNVTFGFTGVR